MKSQSVLLSLLIGCFFVTDPVNAGSKASAESGTTEGIFAGIEQGDYMHFLIQNKNAQTESFIVLKDHPSMKSWIDNPDGMKGRRLRVHWKMEQIPEAGEKMKVAVKVERRTTD